MRTFKLTQQQVAQITGYTQATVSKYFRGERHPEIPFVIELAKYVGKPIGWFWDQAPDLDLRAIRRRLSKVLEYLELGDEELAAVLRVYPQRIQEILDGSAPSAQELNILKSTFGLDPWWLISGQGSMFPGRPPTPWGTPETKTLHDSAQNPLPPDLERVMDKLRMWAQSPDFDTRFSSWLDLEIDKSRK